MATQDTETNQDDDSDIVPQERYSSSDIIMAAESLKYKLANTEDKPLIASTLGDDNDDIVPQERYSSSNLIIAAEALKYKSNTEDNTESKKSVKGEFKRNESQFRKTITADGSTGYKAEAGRYHLYYSSACPWCQRVLVIMALKGLNQVISCSNVEPLMDAGFGTSDYIGWEFSDKYPDPLHENSKSVFDIYKIHDPDYDKKQGLSVPIIFDTKTQQIVNNESSEIIEFLNSEFDAFAMNPSLNLNPTSDIAILKTMRQWNEEIYPNLNNGVYRCGMGKSQEAYDAVIGKLFGTLDKMEKCLDRNRYLCGNQMTLTDIRAWVTLIRFDLVYFTHFKCNAKMISHDYPNIWEYTKEIYQMNGVKETCDMDYTKTHYYGAHKFINPHGIIPYGPVVNFDEPHSRNSKFPSFFSFQSVLLAFTCI